ncbi:MAG: hypothetical protein QN193_06535 [Armatimonadota bacterium]|nr:hypothetical protein [Armatimonadota bacterium]MDR7444588.1 hypothetical protein [Armatimonadota bacterium]MDR7570246.1 hypothetical protein [Armatimonadota bacterium]MDR7615558.1 hypothetical protein [Armatimonadota bacterium]
MNESFRDLGLHVRNQAEQLAPELLDRLREAGIRLPRPPWTSPERIARNLLLAYARYRRYDPRLLAFAAISPFVVVRSPGVTPQGREVLPQTPDAASRAERAAIRQMRPVLRRTWDEITAQDLIGSGLPEERRQKLAAQLCLGNGRRGWVRSDAKIDWLIRSLAVIASGQHPPAHPASRYGGYQRDLQLLRRLSELLQLA